MFIDELFIFLCLSFLDRKEVHYNPKMSYVMLLIYVMLLKGKCRILQTIFIDFIIVSKIIDFPLFIFSALFLRYT